MTRRAFASLKYVSPRGFHLPERNSCDPPTIYPDLLEPDAPCPARGGHRVTAGSIFPLTLPFRGSREANSRLSVRDPRCTLDRSLRTLLWYTAIPFLKMIQPMVRTPSRTSPKRHIQQGIDVLYVPSLRELRDGVLRPAETECRHERVRFVVACRECNCCSHHRETRCNTTHHQKFCQLVFETKLARLLDI